MNNYRSRRGHALVIGGGIAGLVTARVLLKHYQCVTILERDRYPDAPAFRSGTPQGKHVHQILLQGQHALETLFPGIGETLFRHGALRHNYGSQTLSYYGGARCLRSSSESLQGWYCSRLLLEYHIRQELRKDERLCVMEQTEVVDLLYRPDTKEVYGVQACPRPRSADVPMFTLTADLVVDASGSTSRILHWLRKHALPTVPESHDSVSLGYATRWYEMPPDFASDWQSIAIQSMEHSKRGGMLVALEHQQWMVVLAGTRKDYPPTDEAGFLAFAQSLPDQALYEVIKDARPLSKIYGYRRENNHFRHFECMERFPEQLIVVGDAVCSFNPIYGQGMTVAALEAVALDAILREWTSERKGFTRHVQRRFARIVTPPWLLATIVEEQAGPESQSVKISRWYINRLLPFLSKDQSIYLMFVEVIHMLRSPLALTRFAGKVLFQK